MDAAKQLSAILTALVVIIAILIGGAAFAVYETQRRDKEEASAAQVVCADRIASENRMLESNKQLALSLGATTYIDVMRVNPFHCFD